MTVICIKDGIIATDSGCFGNGTYVGAVNKIVAINDSVGGGFASGSGKSAKVCAALNALAEHGLNTKIGDDEGISLIWLMGDGSVWAVEKEAIFRIDAKFHAEGSGRDIALGAMAAGASAEEAVLIACDLEQGCKGPMISRSLK